MLLFRFICNFHINLLVVDLLLNRSFIALFLHDKFLLGLDLIDLLLNNHLVELRLFLHLLTEISLEVLEER